MNAHTGCWGFTKDGVSLLTFSDNDIDGLPEFMGESVIRVVKANSKESLHKIFKALLKNPPSHDPLLLPDIQEVLYYNYPPIIHLLLWARNTFTRRFLARSYFPKWYYIIDLDDYTIIIYNRVGTSIRNKQKPRKTAANDVIQYKVTAQFDFDNIPDDWLDKTLQNERL